MGKIRKYSDALLLRMMRAHLPEYHEAEQGDRQARTDGAADGVATKVTFEIVEVGAS